MGQRSKNITDEMRRDIFRMHNDGQSMIEIASTLKLHRHTVGRVINPDRYGKEIESTNAQHLRKQETKLLKTGCFNVCESNGDWLIGNYIKNI